MSAPQDLNEMFREIDRPYECNEIDETLVFVDRKKKTILAKPHFWGTTCFLVHNSNNPKHRFKSEPLSCEIWDNTRVKKLEFEARLTCSIETGKEAQTVLALFEDINIKAGIYKKVRRWIKDFTREVTIAQLADYPGLLTDLKKKISARAYAELGITMQVVLKPIWAKTADPPELRQHFKVLLSDVQGTYTIKVNIDPRVVDLAVFRFTNPFHQASFLNRLENRLQNHFKRNIGAQRFFFETDQLSKEVEQIVLDILKENGLGLNFFSFEVSSSVPIKKDFRASLEKKIDVGVHGLSAPIMVQLHATLELKDLATYLNAEKHPFPILQTCESLVEPTVLLALGNKTVQQLFDFGLLRTDFEATWKDELAAKGLKTNIIHFNVDLNLHIPKSLHLEIPIPFKPFLSDNRVTILNSVTLHLEENKGYLYATQSCPDLKIKLREWVEQALKQELANKTYPFLVQEFNEEEWSEKIKTHLVDEVASLGYRISLLSVLPDLPERRWEYIHFHEKMTFSIKGLAEAELDICLDFQIPLKGNSKITRLINKNIDIHEETKALLTPLLKSFLHDIEPRVFFLQFEDMPDQNGILLKEEIKDIITKALIDRLGAEKIQPSITIDNPKISNRLLMLRSKPITISWLITFKGKADDSLKFYAQIQFIGMHPQGYDTFMNTIDCSLDLVTENLSENLKNKCSSFPPHLLKYEHPDHYELLLEMVQEETSKSALQQFGLVVKVHSINRDHSSREKLGLDEREDDRLLRADLRRIAGESTKQSLKNAADLKNEHERLLIENLNSSYEKSQAHLGLSDEEVKQAKTQYKNILKMGGNAAELASLAKTGALDLDNEDEKEKVDSCKAFLEHRKKKKDADTSLKNSGSHSDE